MPLAAPPMPEAPVAALKGRTAIWCLTGLLAMLSAYILWTVDGHSQPYLDYVDGYYLYVSQRMAQGAALYTQLLGVQPPGIFLVGAALFKLHDSLLMARCYAAALHCGIVLLVFGCGQRLYGRSGLALLAAAIYGIAPYSLVWSRTFDPNPLATFLSVAVLYLLLRGGAASTGAAGICGALSLLTKIWFLPVAVVLLVLLARNRRAQLTPFVLGLSLALAVSCALGTFSYGTAFWQSLTVQSASGTSSAWLVTAIYDVLTRDWVLVLLGVLGMAVLPREGHPGKPLVAWHALASCSILAATIKEGTAAPILQFAEPSLALCAAGALAWIAGNGRWPFASVHTRRPAGSALIVSLACCAALIWTSLPAIRDARTPSDVSERRITGLIAAHSTAGASLLGPPFYLYLTGRREVAEFADVNIWAQKAHRGDPDARRALDSTLALLRAGAIPLVLEDNRVDALDGVPVALRRYYRTLPFSDTLPSDREVALWVPLPR